MSAEASLLTPSRPTSRVRGGVRPVIHLLLSDGAAALCRGLVRIQHAIAGPTPARYHDELDLYLEERYGGHRRWSA